MCQYSLDIKKCEDVVSCCSPKRNEEAAILLAENDGFLPPVTKGKDRHFLNLIHILEYCDKLKIPDMTLTVLQLMQILMVVSVVLNVMHTSQHFLLLLNIRKIIIQNDEDDQPEKRILPNPLTIFRLCPCVMFEF
ncbi:unnamed protein product [Rhizophagus irregularis]|nr:unnamed protein product [Rhizophagus irregularis]